MLTPWWGRFLKHFLQLAGDNSQCLEIVEFVPLEKNLNSPSLCMLRVLETYVGIKISLMIFVLYLCVPNTCAYKSEFFIVYFQHVVSPRKGHADEVTYLDVGLLDAFYENDLLILGKLFLDICLAYLQ